MIIITGIAGSGKSMQGSILAKKLNYQWISIGQLLRNSVQDQDKKAQLMGKLLSDDIVNNTFKKAIANLDNKCVIDGFPRTQGQANWLVEQNLKQKIKVTCVINLVMSENAVMKRLLQRKREDDTENVIRERFKEYKRDILPILEILRKNNINVYEINGDQTIQQVQNDILNVLPKNL